MSVSFLSDDEVEALLIAPATVVQIVWSSRRRPVKPPVKPITSAMITNMASET